MRSPDVILPDQLVVGTLSTLAGSLRRRERNGADEQEHRRPHVSSRFPSPGMMRRVKRIPTIDEWRYWLPREGKENEGKRRKEKMERECSSLCAILPDIFVESRRFIVERRDSG